MSTATEQLHFSSLLRRPERSPGQVYVDERAERRAAGHPPAKVETINEAAWRGLGMGGLVSFKDFLRFQEWAQDEQLIGDEAEEAIDRLIEKRWEQRVAQRREMIAQRQAGRAAEADDDMEILLFGPETKAAASVERRLADTTSSGKPGR